MKKAILFLFFSFFLAKNEATAQSQDSIFIPTLTQRPLNLVESEEICINIAGCRNNKFCISCRCVSCERIEYYYYYFDRSIDYSHRFDLIDFGTEAEYEQMLNQAGFLPAKKQKWYKETL